jgi:hypothetical protein
MRVLYIPWICCSGCDFFSNCIINWLDAWKDENFVTRKFLQGKQRNAKKATKKGSDLVCGQYIDACKLGANIQVEHNKFTF